MPLWLSSGSIKSKNADHDMKRLFFSSPPICRSVNRCCRPIFPPTFLEKYSCHAWTRDLSRFLFVAGCLRNWRCRKSVDCGAT
ncbi:hypothetical protein APHAL10511_006661 [Amanita phalloides]|nr:hypothetical protein APHAL10511_006661 [Amanita phalloides]